MTLRRAERRDWARLFSWRNSIEAAIATKTMRDVTLAEHLNWLQRLGDGTCVWIAEETGSAVGMIRLDIANDIGTVSLAVDPKHRGRGIARTMLYLLDFRAREADMNIGRLRAEVRPQNYASLRLFTDAGYELDETSVSEEFVRFEKRI